jgi:hypothetical protein
MTRRIEDVRRQALRPINHHRELAHAQSFVWSNISVRVMAGNVSGSTVDLAAAALSVQVTKGRVA